MKNILPMSIVLLIPYMGSAQVTITNADMPDAGDSVRVSYALTLGPVNHTLTDTNYVWDFSFLTPTAQERIEFITPTAFPFNFLSDMGVTNQSPDSLPGFGAVPTNFTDYYRGSSSSFRQVGSTFDYAPIGSFSIPIIYSSPDYIYRFPLNYGSTDTSDAAYGFSIPGIGYIGQDRHRVNVVDGWGILITPLDTYQVVRVRSVVDAIDTVSLDTASQTGFTVPRPTEIQYKWLAPGMKLPVLEIDCQVLFSAEVVTNIMYQDTLRDSLWQVTVNENADIAPSVAVFPNPAQDIIIVQYENVNSGNLDFTVTDIQGRIVYSDHEKNAGSAGFKQIDVSNFSPGIYFVSVRNEAGTVVSKFVIN